jgi:hypothetical protein
MKDRQHPSMPSRRERDRDERRRAARLSEVFPHWLIMWGAWSRHYWGYPRFRAPRGTIVHAADPGDLAAQMRQVQAAVRERRGR